MRTASSQETISMSFFFYFFLFFVCWFIASFCFYALYLRMEWAFALGTAFSTKALLFGFSMLMVLTFPTIFVSLTSNLISFVSLLFCLGLVLLDALIFYLVYEFGWRRGLTKEDAVFVSGVVFLLCLALTGGVLLVFEVV